MKKIIFTISLLSVSCLFGENYFTKAKPIVLATHTDEIEVLVNDFLGEKKSPVRYKQTKKEYAKEGTYFVQMFAYSASKPLGLIQKIRQKGYRTISQKAWRNDKQVNLLLVGPYSSRDEVRRYLADLRGISQGAFIYKGQ